jgi:hypothetical protein
MITSCNGVPDVKAVVSTAANPAAGDPVADIGHVAVGVLASGYGAGSSVVKVTAHAAVNADPAAGVMASQQVNAPTSIIINCSLSIVKVSNSLQSGLNVPSFTEMVKLHVPGYWLEPSKAEEYMDKEQKTIMYTDTQQYSLMNLKHTNNFSTQVASGIKALKTIIIVPFISGNVHGVTAPIVDNGITLQPARGPFATYRSPFCSEPATTSPLPNCFEAMNVRVSGQNLLANDLRYSFEVFEQMVAGIDADATAGNLGTGMSSSLMNKDRWKNNYQYYVFDCSRKLIQENLLSQSVDIYGFVKSLVDVDAIVFMEYVKSLTFNIRSGALVSVVV